MLTMGGRCCFVGGETEAGQGKGLFGLRSRASVAEHGAKPKHLAFPGWTSGTHHSSDPVISALFALLMTRQYLPETHLFSLKTAKTKQELCHSGRMFKLPLDFCSPFPVMDLSVPRKPHGWISPPPPLPCPARSPTHSPLEGFLALQLSPDHIVRRRSRAGQEMNQGKILRFNWEFN